MNIFRRCWITVTTLMLLAPAHAGVLFQLNVETRVEPAEGTQGTPADTRTSLVVTLADKYIAVKSPKETTVYEFDKRRRVVIDNASRTRVDHSLYDSAGFRVLELRNRDKLGQALAAAKISVMAPVDNEHILAIQDKPSAPLAKKTDGVDEVFSHGGRLYFRRGPPAVDVSPDDARMFAQFMRQAVGGHPQILAELAAAKTIPSRFVIVTYDVTVTTRRYVVTSIRPFAGVRIDVDAHPLRPDWAAPDAVDEVLDRAAAITPAELAAARQRMKDELATAFREERGLDAFLGCVEWTLMTGEGMPALSPEQVKLLQSNAATQRVNSALVANTKESVADAIKLFDELKPATPAKAHVLKVFEANNRAMQGDAKAAQRLFVEVLNTNPHIAGVYKDLGDVLIRAFDAPRAWRSWDAGRRIAPKFENFDPVNEFERSLVSGHPEFF